MKRIKAIGWFGILLVTATSVQAMDSLSVEVGDSFTNPGTVLVRVGGQWNWDKKWLTTGNWSLGGHWDTSIGKWHTGAGSHDVTDFSITPILRWQKFGGEAVLPYVEGGIGVHYLSNTDISDKRRFSTRFQFGSHLGAGLRFGRSGKYDLAYTFQHISNADIDEPNPGIDLHLFRFKHHF